LPAAKALEESRGSGALVRRDGNARRDIFGQCREHVGKIGVNEAGTEMTHAMENHAKDFKAATLGPFPVGRRGS
jgi:hypothetical protein